MRRIDSYAHLEDLYWSWREKYIPFLAVVGPPGVGKSWLYEQVLEDLPHHLFKGRTTAIQIFLKVREHPDWSIVFDDVGQLLRDAACLDLVKSLCDTRPERLVQWNTSSSLVDGGPKEFYTSAAVLLVTNRTIAKKNDDVAAVLDRADTVEFLPSKREILARLRTYAQDLEIVDYLERMPVLPSLRTYQKALDWRKSPRLDWRKEILLEAGVEEHVRVLADILQQYPREKQEHRYCELTGRSRRDFYYQLPRARALLPPE